MHMERMQVIKAVMTSLSLFKYLDDQEKRRNSSPRRILNLTLKVCDEKHKTKHCKKKPNSTHEPEILSINERRTKYWKKKTESDQILPEVHDLTEKSHEENSSVRLFGNVSPRKKLRDTNGHPSEINNLEWTSERKNGRPNHYEDKIKRKLRNYNSDSQQSLMDNRSNKDSNHSYMGVSHTLSLLKKGIVKGADAKSSHVKSSDSQNTSLSLLQQYGEDEQHSDGGIRSEAANLTSSRSSKRLKSVSKAKDDSDDDELEIVSHEQETFKFSPTDLNWQCDMCNKFGLAVLKEINPDQSGVPLAPPAHIRQTSSDGNCFFRCLSYALTGREKEHAKIRKLVTDYMKQIEPQLEKHLGHNMTVEKYLRETEMSELSVWSTDVEIFVSSALLNTDIYVYSYYSHRKWKWVKFPAKQLQPPGGGEINKKAIYLKNTCQLHYDVVTGVKTALD